VRMVVHHTCRFFVKPGMTVRMTVSNSMPTGRISDLVPGGISETWEEGEKLLASSDRGLVLEDNLIELCCGSDLAAVSIQAQRFCRIIYLCV
jgi:hypothetical protein